MLQVRVSRCRHLTLIENPIYVEAKLRVVASGDHVRSDLMLIASVHLKVSSDSLSREYCRIVCPFESHFETFYFRANGRTLAESLL